MFTAVDAFSGAGGLALGLKKSGFDIRVSFDKDPICKKTMDLNSAYFNHKILTKSIEEMKSGILLQNLGMRSGELDLLAGGPPCQGFSVQRTTGSDLDERNLLVGEYGDLISEILPKFFLMENVPGIAGKRGKALLDEFDDKVSSFGYVTHHRVLNAENYGVPQRRRRYFVVGERIENKLGQSTFEWPEITHESNPRTVRDAIGHLPAPPNNGQVHNKISLHRADKLSALNLLRIRAISEGQSRVDLPKELLAKCHLDPDKIGHRSTYGRMSWDDVAPTITARFDSFTRGRFGHPVQDRSITLREGALLQTFPRDYAFFGTKVEVARQIGNAIPVSMATAVASAIGTALQKRQFVEMAMAS